MKEGNNLIEEIDKTYNSVIDDIKKDINRTQLDIMVNANISLVNLYYRIGKVLCDNSFWGNKFLDKLAFELKMSYPNQKGFSIRNLKYMKTFYNEYKNDSEFVQLVAQLPWTHNIILIEKVKNKIIRKWYIENCLNEGWSKNVLIYQIDTNLYRRQIKNTKHNNFDLTLKQNSDLASNMMKDPYVFDIIELTNDFKEKELENKMLERLKNVLLELGNGFSFVDNQYRITVGNKDFYIDLLFYHTKLKCYIAVELKIAEFLPEYGSKMGFYLQALDEQIKDKTDNPSIGIILCQNKNNKIVDYTLKYINKPVGVSEYKILDKLTIDYMKNLPNEKEINEYLDIN
ncbi:MAG: DUF1016 family protein [Bacilli bacterium]|nr:DUF1016 family protein [Bacilli bacterium]